MKRGHVPIRQCVACRTRRPAREMIRLSVSGERVTISPGKDDAPGRGCYTCPEDECLEKTLNRRILERALKKRIAAIPSIEEFRGRHTQGETG